jgi:uncharacterized membrane protein YdbT with pleckstrin-like domain
MIKVVIAVVLILTSAGAWLYLDCLNKQEQGANEKIHIGIEQARAEAKKRMSAKASFELQINTNLTNCQAAAEKAKADYANLMQEIMPRKRGQIVTPPSITDGIEKVLATAKAECQQIYDTQLKDGH